MTDYSDWIGRKLRRVDTISGREIAHFRAALAGTLGPGAVPPGFHWTLAPDLAEPADLGRDGHPKPGIFVPALPLPRRMWAGGEIAFEGELSPGDTVVRDTTVSDITFKTGSTGQLGFVAVHHDWSVDGKAVVRERHDIVYREAAKPGEAPKPPKPAPTDATWTRHVLADPVLLFRFSALTFNGHRIHYDADYTRDVEGYPALVVNGSVSTLFLFEALLRRHPGAQIRSYEARTMQPVFCNRPAFLCGEAPDAEGQHALWVEKEDGAMAIRIRTRIG